MLRLRCHFSRGFSSFVAPQKPFTLFLALVLAAGATQCSVRPIPAASQGGRVYNYTDCALPSDQGAGSYQGRWASLPIPLVLDRDFYLTDEGGQAAQIKLAVATWNSWAALRGFTAFRITNDGAGLGAGDPIPVTSDCSQATISSARQDVVGIWKIQAGGDGRNTRIVNGTACKLLDSGIQGKVDWTLSGTVITNASILLNFDQFNNSPSNTLDLQSLALHELGHVLGLLHSCNSGNDTTTSPSCGVAPGRYLEAVMFPYLTYNEIRRQLRQNDYSRINCIY